MFLRRHRKHARGEHYDYWSLVKTVRTARGPRQQLVAHLGKLDGNQARAVRQWDDLDQLLEGKPAATQLELNQPPSPPPSPLWRTVNLHAVRVERVRQFGRVYLALALWRRLGLQEWWRQRLPPGGEDIGWDVIGCILTLGRFCAQKSEWSIAQRWYEDTALEDLLGVPFDKINDARLYRGLDELLPHKEALCQHLLERYRSWFGTRLEFLLYDVTSTYFEGQATHNDQAARGYSRDSRPDCQQVCIGLVVTPEGLPIAYEVFDGNRTDVTTLKDIVQLMEDKYGAAQRLWVFDRGIVSEENLDWLRQRQALYLVGTPKSQLRCFEQALLDPNDWHCVRDDVEVKRLAHPDGKGNEQFVLCRSRARREKEKAMLARQEERLLRKLIEIDASLRQRPAAVATVERRVGRWLGRYPAADKLFEVHVITDPAGQACALQIACRLDRSQWTRQAHGAYLLRTNHRATDPAQLWRWYIQLTQAEAAFRTSKSDLLLRPIFHQRTKRVQAHILVCFLALALWRVLEQWMQSKGLGSCARELLHELNELHSMDVVLPTDAGIEIRLRVVARPEKELAQLLAHLGLDLPQAPRILSDVVQKTTPPSS